MELSIIVIGSMGLAGAWIACGVAAYKATIAYFLREFASLRFTLPTRGFKLKPEMLNDKRSLAIATGLLGPLGLLVIAIVGGGFKHGLSRPSVEELEGLAREWWGPESMSFAETKP